MQVGAYPTHAGGMDTNTFDRRLLRAPGWAALIAGLAFLPQPLFVFLLPAPDGSEFLPPGQTGQLALRWTLQALAWGVFPAATIVLVAATSRLAPDGLWTPVSTAFGIIGGAGWLAESAFRLSPLSQPAQHLSAAPVPPATQGSIMYLLDVFGFGWTALGFLGISVWLFGVGVARMLPLSRVLRVLLVLVGAVTIVLFYALPALPLSAFAVYLLFLAMGLELLVRARSSKRADDSSDTAPTPRSPIPID